MRSTLFASLACHACPLAAMQRSQRNAAPLMRHPQKSGGASKLVGASRAAPFAHATRLHAASSATATEVWTITGTDSLSVSQCANAGHAIPTQSCEAA